MGVRLLLEGGSPQIADQTSWSNALVKAYVDVERVTQTIVHARHAPGVEMERNLVTIALFKRWITALPPEELAAAAMMLDFFTAVARDHPWSFFSDRDLASKSFEALREVAKIRPEFRVLAAEGVAAAVVTKLADMNINALFEALNTAQVYLDAFGTRALHNVVSATLGILALPNGGQMPWTVVDPALTLLSSVEVDALCIQVPELRHPVSSALLRTSLESETENTRLLFLLKNLDPAVFSDEIDAKRLETIVADIRKHAAQINSTATTGNIMALLVAPAVAKQEGVREAINALHAILRSASTGNTAISFAAAYHPLMYLTEHRSDIARDLGFSEEEVTAMVAPLLDTLVKVWQKVPENPLVFSGFAIPPPSIPNPTLVHNWTFASIGFARSLGQADAMAVAMKAAMHHKQLETPMSVARAIRVTAGDIEPFDLQSLRAEKREAFYAALGQRLVLLRALPTETSAEVVNIFLEQCCRLGPKGLDAGVFATALEHGIRLEHSPEAASYRRRVDNDAELRLTLRPLFDALRPLDGGVA